MANELIQESAVAASANTTALGEVATSEATLQQAGTQNPVYNIAKYVANYDGNSWVLRIGRGVVDAVKGAISAVSYVGEQLPDILPVAHALTEVKDDQKDQKPDTTEERRYIPGTRALRNPKTSEEREKTVKELVKLARNQQQPQQQATLSTIVANDLAREDFVKRYGQEKGPQMEQELKKGTGKKEDNKRSDLVTPRPDGHAGNVRARRATNNDVRDAF